MLFHRLSATGRMFRAGANIYSITRLWEIYQCCVIKYVFTVDLQYHVICTDSVTCVSASKTHAWAVSSTAIWELCMLPRMEVDADDQTLFLTALRRPVALFLRAALDARAAKMHDAIPFILFRISAIFE